MKTPFKGHIQALVRDKLSEEKEVSCRRISGKKKVFLNGEKLTISAFQTVYLEIFTIAKSIIYLRWNILRIPILKKNTTTSPTNPSQRKSAVLDVD